MGKREKLFVSMPTTAADYLQAIAVGSETIAQALEADPDREVPACPGWDVDQLAKHVGLLHARVGEQVRRRSPEPVRVPAPPNGPARVGWLRDASGRLLGAFDVTDEDAPAGSWRQTPVTAGFWRRRMAHETVVHRVDTEEAFGWPTTLDGDLAADGLDEVLGLFLPFATHQARWPPEGALWLVRADGPGQWWVEPRADRVDVRRRPPEAGRSELRWSRVEAPAADLFLACWGRRALAPAMVTGTRALLDQWISLMAW